MYSETAPFRAVAVATTVAEATLLAVAAPGSVQSPSVANVNTPNAFRQVTVRGFVNFQTVGTFTLRCRQGIGTGGAQVDVSQPVAAVAAGTSSPFEFVDNAPTTGESNYTITCSGVTGTAVVVTAHVAGV